MERNFRDSAREFGYEPWTSFTFFEWYIASRMIKKPTIQLMRERLFDPEKAHPDWFITFAKAIETIGEDCASAENLYAFVQFLRSLSPMFSLAARVQAARRLDA